LAHLSNLRANVSITSLTRSVNKVYITAHIMTVLPFTRLPLPASNPLFADSEAISFADRFSQYVVPRSSNAISVCCSREFECNLDMWFPGVPTHFFLWIPRPSVLRIASPNMSFPGVQMQSRYVVHGSSNAPLFADSEAISFADRFSQCVVPRRSNAISVCGSQEFQCKQKN
jgi:hypothetical protein